MIGSGLKKLANENGMKVSNGVGYGALRGYAATLSEGSGYKQMVVTTKFADPEKLQQLQAQINQRDVSREFRVQNITFAPNGISVTFLDNPGTMKKITAFMDWFFPLLDVSSASKAEICTECGMPITGGSWKLVDGIAFHLHEACAEKLQRSIDAEDEARKEADTGSYGMGLLGALLGSALGAVVWAVVLYMGYVASLVGLLIGWLSEKGYSLLRGKQGKGKIVILIVAIILGVILGTFAADVISIVELIGAGELPGLGLVDVPMIIAVTLAESDEYRSAVLSNILMGLLFAALGASSLLMKTGKTVAKTKIVDLK